MALGWCGHEQLSLKSLDFGHTSYSWQSWMWWEVFSLWPCAWRSQVTNAPGLWIKWQGPHHHQPPRRCLLISAPCLRHSSHFFDPRQPRETLSPWTTEKEQSSFPWTTGYPATPGCRSGIWGWSQHQRKQETDGRDRMPAVLIWVPASSYAWS